MDCIEVVQTRKIGSEPDSKTINANNYYQPDDNRATDGNNSQESTKTPQSPARTIPT
jgi:hypothetical protein